CTKKKSYDFINYYEPSVDSKLSGNKQSQHHEEIETNKENVIKEEKKHDKKKNKRKNESIDVSNIDQSSTNINANISFNSSKVTSTPKAAIKTLGEKVKSIMKSIPTAAEDSLDRAEDDTSNAKSRRKKRNKSVSFMLDDAKPEAKKSKSNTSEQSTNEEVPKKKDKKNKLSKFNSGKENKLSNTKLKMELDEGKASIQHFDAEETTSENQVSNAKIKKKKSKKIVKSDIEEAEIGNEEDNKIKKKKKRQSKETAVAFGEEPAPKSSRKTEKPDMIAESLENLNLGSNAHTLTDLIDQMTVADKSNKKKKLKGKKDKAKNDKTKKEDTKDDEEAKEKIKWTKKKWNKGRRDFIHVDRIQTSVIIENLPLTAMFSYKNILSEHFSNCGQIKQIGIAELYPGENPKPVFNTTILFDTEDAATKALEEDNTLLEGNRIRVKRPLPYNQTTIVVRTYAELTEQTLSTMFSSAGRIRKIKLLVKGKKLSSTAFIEFDSAEAVERAVKSVEGVLINRKKVNVFKYQDEYGRKENNKGGIHESDS
ncbi:cylicin-1-like, partial [Aricia agestis]|uniref:cylicin-1-like n=1 Tax=Aricia agestis TaxID=91739 RepID=UPI001C20AE2B